MKNNTPNTSYKALWITMTVLGILAITAIILFALYVKKSTSPQNVSDKVFDVMSQGFDWMNEDYASDLVADGRNDKVASANNGGSSSSSNMLATLF